MGWPCIDGITDRTSRSWRPNGLVRGNGNSVFPEESKVVYGAKDGKDEKIFDALE